METFVCTYHLFRGVFVFFSSSFLSLPGSLDSGAVLEGEKVVIRRLSIGIRVWRPDRTGIEGGRGH